MAYMLPKEINNVKNQKSVLQNLGICRISPRSSGCLHWRSRSFGVEVLIHAPESCSGAALSGQLHLVLCARLQRLCRQDTAHGYPCVII